MITQLTPNLAVDRIEPSAEFFSKVGFEVTVQVPEDDHMGFAILVNGTQQIMFQTRTSIKDDCPEIEDASTGSPVLIFITVPDVKAVAQALNGYDVAMDWRETFYGSTEIGFREPGGHIVTFAQFPAEEA
ncbi:VOC family protein [Kordiimonas lacus]|uniref:Predicted lactoylglutathione lyase n=1 Tax=Kordiimonas lacus TaxID=637679 RepID=A0A1G6T4I1_9PROT|nr:VOC family protein [Kordiimonas lacus]SDD23958.1 Predicted lactoylglutathione lyase [Kordiimonas lacus]